MVKAEDLTRDDVLRVSTALRNRAEVFVQRQWKYGSAKDLQSIRYKPTKSLASRSKTRLRHFMEHARNEEPYSNLYSKNPTLKDHFQRIRTAFEIIVYIDDNLPDGQVDDYNILTNWREHGEYITMVQPMVGSKVCDLLDAEPESIHAKIIAAEILNTAPEMCS